MPEPWVPPGPALLFVPADRPDRHQKAAIAADLVILDLEDGVASDRKEQARRAVATGALDPERTVVRVNPGGTDEQTADLAMLAHTRHRLLMLAKTESAQQVRQLAEAGYRVLALLETPLGVVRAEQIAAEPGCVALMWGSEDLLAAMGGYQTRFPGGPGAGTYRDVPRSARARVALAAGAFGVAMVDAVFMDVGDFKGLAQEASDAAAQGFAATACIHPSQVPVVRAAYAPTPELLAWADRILSARARSEGVVRVDGRMVDGPLYRQAQTIRRRSPR